MARALVSSRLRLAWLMVALTALLALLLLSTAAGASITEFNIPTAESAPRRIALGPDGNLWFTESHAEKIGRITPAGVITEYGPTSGAPEDITAGPDGALWFTEPGASKIGRITVAGAITKEFDVPVMACDGQQECTRPEPAFGTCSPFWNQYGTAITAGPDGLWFTGACAYNVLVVASVGRITTSGVITAFRAPSIETRPADGITTGSDTGGNRVLWFTARGTFGNEVASVTTSGEYREFFPPWSLFGNTFDIAEETDGALWFTDSQNDKVGSIMPSGDFSPVSGFDVHGSPTGITVGPDGALWFAESSATRIGRLTTSGVYTECVIPAETEFPFGANSVPVDITSGPDGAVWFTEQADNQIGRITDCPPSGQGASSDLSLTKTDSPDPVTVGNTLTYTLTAHNGGPDAATAVEVTDNLSPGVAFASASPSRGSCSDSSGTVTCALGGLASGGSATVEIKVTPQSAATITNTASISGDQHDPEAENNSASAQTTVNSTVTGSNPLTLGYWKNHLTKGSPDTNEYLPQYIGGYKVDTTAKASAIFTSMNCGTASPSSQNAIGCLAGHLLASELNLANGSDKCIAALVAKANAWLSGTTQDGVPGLPYAGPYASYPLTKGQRNEAIALKNPLDKYNNGGGC
jgi:virginiamycin B lyase